MPTIDDVYGSSETLRASHLPAGRSIPVVIERATLKHFDDCDKLEIAFRGKDRVLICNQTNASSIAMFVGTRDYTQWPGKTIWLMATKTDFRGRVVDCVRVDETPPARPASHLQGAEQAAPAPQQSPAPAGYDPVAEAAALPPGDDIPF